MEGGRAYLGRSAIAVPASGLGEPEGEPNAAQKSEPAKKPETTGQAPAAPKAAEPAKKPEADKKAEPAKKPETTGQNPQQQAPGAQPKDESSRPSGNIAGER